MKKSKTSKTNISASKTLENSSKLPLALLGIGIKMVKLELLELHPEHACLIEATYKRILKTMSLLKRKNQSYVMPESVPGDSWATLKDKSIFLERDILTQTWLRISPLASIGNVKDYLPYWNEQCKVASEKLYLPTETDAVDSPLNSMNTSLPYVESKSLCLITANLHPQTLNSQMIFSPLSMSTLADKWENADTSIKQNKEKNKQKNKRSAQDKPPPTGVLKIRIVPTRKQKQVFKRWIGSYNYTWNCARQEIENKTMYPNFISLKNKYAIDNQLDEDKQFLLFTPNKIRQAAINELCSAYEVAKVNRQRNNIKYFKIGKKIKKKQKRCFTFPIPREGISLYSTDLNGTKTTDCDGQRKTHVTLYPNIMFECMTQTKTRKPRCVLTPENQRYKKLIAPEMWTDYVLFMDELGIPLYTQHLTLSNRKYKQLVAPEIWDDYIWFVSKYGGQIYNTPDMVSSSKPDKILKSKPEYTPFIRFCHRNNDRLLYNITIDYDCKLCYKYGSWYLHIPYIRQKQRVEPGYNEDDITICGSDPGFKTFNSFYSNKDSGKIQQDTRFKYIRKQLDYYNTLFYGKKKNNIYTSQPHRIKYKKFKYKTNLLYRKQSNLADDMHYKTINFYTSRYNYILLPSFETQDMVQGYILSKETKREASQLQHYRFKQRLQSACSQMKYCKVLIVSEAWTSKTCGNCGTIKHELTLKDRVFHCNHCHITVDRDVHAARNIILRNLWG